MFLRSKFSLCHMFTPDCAAARTAQRSYYFNTSEVSTHYRPQRKKAKVFQYIGWGLDESLAFYCGNSNLKQFLSTPVCSHMWVHVYVIDSIQSIAKGLCKLLCTIKLSISKHDLRLTTSKMNICFHKELLVPYYFFFFFRDHYILKLLFIQYDIFCMFHCSWSFQSMCSLKEFISLMLISLCCLIIISENNHNRDNTA